MIPTANFTYSVDGLEVTFTDRSTQGPTSWSWDFGDGETSTDQDPSHIYSRRGFFVVTLISTNADGPSEAFQLSVGVSDTGITPLPKSIYDIVLSYIPSGVDINIGELDGLIKKWQLYLQPLINDIVIEDAHVYDEFYWPPLANQLIAELIAFDLILQAISLLISSSSSSSSGTAGGALKKVVTGPSTAEWHGPSEANDSVNNMVKPGGSLDTLKEQICMLAKRLRIWLPICSDLREDTNVPEIFEPIRDAYNIIIS